MRGNLTLTASVYACYGFTKNGDHSGSEKHDTTPPTAQEVRAAIESQRRSVVIAPIRISEAEDEATLIAWGCSHGKMCRNGECRYSGKDDGVRRFS